MVSVLLLGFCTATGRPPTSGDSVRTLSALVPAAVDGVVRDVHLLATASGEDLGAVADHAGCGFVRESSLGTALAAGSAQARSPHLLVLLAGTTFDRAFVDEMAALGGRHEAWLTDGASLKAVEGGALARLMPRFAPTVGVLTTRDRLTGARPATVPALWRALRPRRLFKTRAWSGGGP